MSDEEYALSGGTEYGMERRLDWQVHKRIKKQDCVKQWWKSPSIR